jgi:hypothetical protein
MRRCRGLDVLITKIITWIGLAAVIVCCEVRPRHGQWRRAGHRPHRRVTVSAFTGRVSAGQQARPDAPLDAGLRACLLHRTVSMMVRPNPPAASEVNAADRLAGRHRVQQGSCSRRWLTRHRDAGTSRRPTARESTPTTRGVRSAMKCATLTSSPPCPPHDRAPEHIAVHLQPGVLRPQPPEPRQDRHPTGSPVGAPVYHDDGARRETRCSGR